MSAASAAFSIFSPQALAARTGPWANVGRSAGFDTPNRGSEIKTVGGGGMLLGGGRAPVAPTSANDPRAMPAAMTASTPRPDEPKTVGNGPGFNLTVNNTGVMSGKEIGNHATNAMMAGSRATASMINPGLH